MSWSRKFDYIGARSFDDILALWSRRSPVGIEIVNGRLAEHIEAITASNQLPSDGNRFVGPIESRALISELYCGVAKAFNLSFHAQTLAKSRAYTNGSLHSFNSLIQFMYAIMSIFGIFVIRIGGKYFVVDVFPWLGYQKLDRSLRKDIGGDWWRHARIIADTKENIEQREMVLLFQRCLRVVSVAGWKEIVIGQLIGCEQRWFNRPRNNILYNFTGWTGSADLVTAYDCDVAALLKSAARTIFDYDEQTKFGSLPQSLLLGTLLIHVWNRFRGSVSMELGGEVAPAFPVVGDPAFVGLIAEFDVAMNAVLSEAV